MTCLWKLILIKNFSGTLYSLYRLFASRLFPIDYSLLPLFLIANCISPVTHCLRICLYMYLYLYFHIYTYVYIYIYRSLSLYIYNIYIYIWICIAVLDKLRHRKLQVALCERLVSDCLELGEDRCCFLDLLHVELGLLDVLVLVVLEEALAQLLCERSEHLVNL